MHDKINHFQLNASGHPQTVSACALNEISASQSIQNTPVDMVLQPSLVTDDYCRKALEILQGKFKTL